MNSNFKKIGLSLVAILSLLDADTLTLKSGWNNVGINTTTTLDEILTQITQTKMLVINGGGKVYKKSNIDNGTPTANTFTNMLESKGYWFKVASDSNLTYTAPSFSGTKTISLKTGWNNIAPYTAMTLDEITQQIPAENLLVINGGGKVYKKSNIDNGTPTANTFTAFTLTKGYWIKVANNVDLVFNLGGDTLPYDVYDSELRVISYTMGNGYSLKVLSDNNLASTNPSNDVLQIIGTVGTEAFTLNLHSDYSVGTKFVVQVWQGSNLIGTSNTMNVTQLAGTLDAGTVSVQSVSSSSSDTSTATSVTSGSSTYYAAKDAFGMESSTTVSGNTVRVFVNEQVATGTTNTLVTGSINGVSTGYGLNINSSYKTGDKVIVKVYGSDGNLVAESMPIAYEGNSKPISFGNITFAVAAQSDTTAPSAPVIEGASPNSLFVTAEAGSIIKVYNGTTIIATATATGSLQSIYFPKLTTTTNLVVTATDASANVSQQSYKNITIATQTPVNTAPTMGVKSKYYTFTAGSNQSINFANDLIVQDAQNDYVRYSADFPFFGMNMNMDGTFNGTPVSGNYTGKVKACDIYNACVTSDNITIQVNQPQSSGTTNNNVALPIVYGTPLSASTISTSMMTNGLTIYEPNGDSGYTKIVISQPSNTMQGTVSVTDYSYDGTEFTVDGSKPGTYTMGTNGVAIVNMGEETGEFSINGGTNITMNGISAIEYMTSFKQTSVSSEDNWESQPEWTTGLAMAQPPIVTTTALKDSFIATTSSKPKNWLWSPNGPRVLGSNGNVYPAQVIEVSDNYGTHQEIGTVGTTPISGASWALSNNILSVTFENGSTQKFKFETPPNSINPMLMVSYKDAVGTVNTMSSYSVEQIAKDIVKTFYSNNHKETGVTGGYIPSETEIATIDANAVGNKEFYVDINGVQGSVKFLKPATGAWQYFISSPNYNETGTWSISTDSKKIVFTRPSVADYYVAVTSSVATTGYGSGYRQEGTTKYPVTFYGSNVINTQTTYNAMPWQTNFNQVQFTMGSSNTLDLKTYFDDDQGKTGLTFSADWLPSGLTISEQNLSGTPTMGGVYNIGVRACDTASMCMYGNLNINVVSSNVAPPSVPTTPTVETPPTFPPIP